ncbi:MAG: Rieske 2Fe-2S domain-containing protein [Rubrobacteraceae bacterium]|uniref:Rieske 2Fe-2S domain-containing protein n=1 Tax=Rubrobacter naiadicus TaxID=1392641 RepID=UPI00235EC9F1|nr:Rieske 2Fe-2S domain-containing protein [Rubrobacter naiadicus]MBX6762988.1 Rieske 2Fe-2S domain-containing protein [Rubrobacteraceae bacterium]MCL6438009.1 Rieske 2Fe-2S domain-containing protein [Rubrobacteraceae bacterium]
MSSEATLKWVEVATLDDLWEGEMMDVEVDGEEVLLVHLPGGRVVAYQGICPHQEYSLVEGELDEETNVLTCAAHEWQFDVRNGEGVNPIGCRLYQYEVKVDEDETIHVGYPESDREHRYNRCREEEE